LLGALGQLGALVERQSWLVWMGVAAVGTVVGLLWALHHPPAPGSTPSAPPSAPQASVSHRPAPPARPEVTPLPADGEAAQLQQAWSQYRAAEQAYKASLQAYQLAVSEYLQGRRTKPEVERARAQMQQDGQRFLEAQRALRNKVLDDGP
jgi:hypothetical protein